MTTQTVFSQLMDVIDDRKKNRPKNSYTSLLFDGGVEKIGEKITEEAREVVQAAQTATDAAGCDHLVHEAADLIYHLFVMLGYRNVRLSDVESRLAARFGISGLDEKASRGRNG